MIFFGELVVWGCAEALRCCARFGIRLNLSRHNTVKTGIIGLRASMLT